MVAEQTKVDQLVQHFYSKTCAVVSQARATHLAALDDLAPVSPVSVAAASTSSVSADARPAGTSRRASAGAKDKVKRVNKWFNLELPDVDVFRTELKTWRNLSRLVPSPTSSFSRTSSSSSASSALAPAVPPMVLDVVLETSDLTPNQVLVLSDQRGKRLRVPAPRAPTSPGPGPGRASPLPRSGGRSPLPGSGGGARGGSSSAPSVVLERWVLTLNPPSAAQAGMGASGAAELPTVYKHAILHFRALFTLLRALPAYALHRKLARTRAGGLRVGLRMGVGAGEEPSADIGVDEVLEGGETERERIVFPGVETPLGTLSLTLTYRLNTDFSVEEIETLLSSRFIDEDFFRPTLARYRAEPGSLPIVSTSPARASPPGAPPGVRGVAGLAAPPSYGSLSSRHQYAPIGPPPPAAPSPLSRSPRTTRDALPAPVPLVPAACILPGTGSPAPSPRPPSIGSHLPSHGSGSSPRFAPYAPAPHSAAAAPSTSATGVGAGVEPAFISLSRARGASFTASAAAGGGVQRASPLSASPSGGVGVGAGAPILRRTSLTSSSGGGASPIFRPGSYLAMGASAASTSSPSYAPAGRQQPHALTSGGGGAGGSPLAGGGSPRPGPVSYGSQGSYTRSGIIRSTSGGSADDAASPLTGAGPGPGVGVGVGVGIGIGISGTSGHTRRPSAGAAARGLSFGVAGSVGRASTAGGGGPGGAGGPSRLGTMMAQYDAAGARAGAATPGATPPPERRRFVHEGQAPDDADEISAFLGMLDAKPDLRASESALGRSGVGAVVSKREVDEQLRLLRSSVFGFAGSAAGESPSPPVLFAGAGPGGGASPSPRSVGALSGLSGLRRQTSQLSIEEDPAAEAAARSPSTERPPAVGTAVDKTPRALYRPLTATKRELASPTLSATSAGTAIPPLSPSPAHALGGGALGIEPRFLPLPNSSKTSPLASPGVMHPQPHPHPHPHPHANGYAAYPSAAGVLERQPYPPLPYPPASSEPVTIAARRPSVPLYLSRAARQPLPPPGFAACASGTASEETSAAASVASVDVDAVGGGGGGSNSYAGEEEAVGRLELDDSPAPEQPAGADAGGERRGRWAASTGAVDEEEIAALAHVQALRSRDATPAAARIGGTGGAAAGYFAPRRRSGNRDEGGDTSPPEISWMG
ncbi:hypothetical protein JCM3770_005298 [Rhodotorula araucariae]